MFLLSLVSFPGGGKDETWESHVSHASQKADQEEKEEAAASKTPAAAAGGGGKGKNKKTSYKMTIVSSRHQEHVEEVLIVGDGDNE